MRIVDIASGDRQLEARDIDCRSQNSSDGVDSLDGKEWPKVQQGRAALSEILADASVDSEGALVEALFGLLE